MYLFVSKVYKFVSRGPVYVRGTCLCQGYLFEGGVDLGEQPVASCKAPDGVDPVPPSVVVLMLLELSGQ